MNKLPLFISVFLLVFATLLLSPSLIQAQNKPVDVVTTLVVTDQEAVDGDILISTDKGLTRAIKAFDNQLFGVVQENSLAIYQSSETNAKPVARTGIIYVNVTTLNGSINPGDYITSSPISGKGQLAQESGYVLGVALEGFNEQTASQITYQGQNYRSGQVRIALRVEYAELSSPRSVSRLFGNLGNGIFTASQNPEELTSIIRYAAAGFALVASFLIGFFTFYRSSVRGIEAIGRNPLAKNSIQFSIILNTILTILIIGAGIAASFLILRF